MPHAYPPYCRNFSYIGRFRYLITCVTFDRTQLFTHAEIVALVWRQIARGATERQFGVFVYCFMPDHLHLIVEGLSGHSNLKKFVKLAKQYSGYYFRLNRP